MSSKYIKESMQDENLMIYERAFDVLSKEIAVGFYEWMKKNKRFYKRKKTEDLFDIFIDKPTQ